MRTYHFFPCWFCFVLFLFSGLLHAEETKTVTADKDRIIKTVQFLSEENFPRSATNQNKEKTLDFLVQSITKAGLEATRSELAVKRIVSDDDYLTSLVPHADKTAVELRSTPYTNINALKKGKTDKRIVIGAHYDALRITPGADDNASGVAALIELAYLLKDVPQLNCDIEIAFYDGEEIDCYGSKYHARKLKNQKIDVVCMLCADMVGFFSDEANSQGYPNENMKQVYGTTADFLAILGKPESIPMIRVAQKAFQESTTLKTMAPSDPKELELLLWAWGVSDYESFSQEGYSFLLFMDTYDYRNGNYHQRSDTWNTLDYNRLAQVPVGMYHTILTIDAAQKP